MRAAHLPDRGLNAAPVASLVLIALPVAFGSLLRRLEFGFGAVGAQ
jgi:hypothetical protein